LNKENKCHFVNKKIVDDKNSKESTSFSNVLKNIPNTETQLISENGSTKPLDHETTDGLQDMVTRGERGYAAATDMTVTAVRPRRRTLWSRTKRFAR